MDLLRITVCLLGIIVLVHAESELGKSNASSPNSAISVIGKVYGQCEQSNELVKCLKSQALKLVSRAIRLQNIKLIDGFSIVKKQGIRDSRAYNDIFSNGKGLDGLSNQKLDELLADFATQLMDSHQIEVNVPRLLTNGQQELSKLVEEGRKKKKKYYGPFLAAMALKAGILKMAYHSIAIVAGKALIIGKIALVISAIIGLKKLVSPEGHEKTTYEIVKHPHVQQSHTYSSSSNGEFEGHESGGGQYHRSLGEEEMLMQDRVYRAHVPRN